MDKYTGVMSDYTDEPIMVRVHFTDDGWSIDGIDENGNYTEAIWDYYHDVRLTKAAAIEHAVEFAEQHVFPGAPITVQDISVNQKEL